MSEEINPPQQPDGKNEPLPVVLWLLCAFVPSIAGIALLTGGHASQGEVTGIFFFAVACCLCSGIGILRGIKDPAIRILLGLLLAVAFFVLNLIIVVFVGCSGMGRIAP